MSTDYQPKFNRVSLNVLMVASAALIVIFGQSARQMDQKPLPPAPSVFGTRTAAPRFGTAPILVKPLKFNFGIKRAQGLMASKLGGPVC